MPPEFLPPPTLRNAHLQSILASSSLRRALLRRGRPPALARAEEEVIHCSDGTRLQVWRSAHPRPIATALLFHGWEGSVDSTYLIDCAIALFDAGFNVVRLNFRDHGDTHHLNEELFHSCRLAEVVSATEHIADADPLPLVLAGFSLGGNFAMRVSLAADAQIAHAIAVSPVIDPAKGLFAIENAPRIYESYFMRKWRRSLQRKRSLYPELYPWNETLQRARLRELTSWLVERYTDFGSLEAYLDGYAIGGERLSGLSTPATIVAAADDPVIPIEDFHRLQLPDCVELRVTRHGGHCGFIENWRFSSWISRFIVQRLATAVTESDGDPKAATHRIIHGTA